MPDLSHPPKGFGQHPYFRSSLRSYQKNQRRKHRKDSDYSFGAVVSLERFFNPLYPAVYIIPRDRPLKVVDEDGDNIGIGRIVFPFSSNDFFIDWEKKDSIFEELYQTNIFWRLEGIRQLGYLVPPESEDWGSKLGILYLIPIFPHTRWIHSVAVGAMAEIILARNNLDAQERAPVVLTAACHDIAIPAGGDSVKRVDPAGLDEEDSFLWLLRRHKLDRRWKKFGFDPNIAIQWVKGKGHFGWLIDALDKISYTAFDCFHLGYEHQGRVREFCLEHPLVMDVWQDIRFDREKGFFFVSAEKLYNFLLLRAYEHTELLYNPYCRVVDFHLQKLVQPLYNQGLITKEQLLSHNDDWLHDFLMRSYPGEIKAYFEPERFSWRIFANAEERKKFCQALGKRFYHQEYVAPFKTGLDWKTGKGNRLIPLKEVISSSQAELIEEMAKSVSGYYVYFLT